MLTLISLVIGRMKSARGLIAYPVVSVFRVLLFPL